METDYPDSTTNGQTVTMNGLLMSSRDKTGLVTTYLYDGLGRMTGVTDARIGTTVTHYNEKGEVDYVEDPAGNRTTYGYDPETGLKIFEVNAEGKAVRYAYDLMGRLVRTWGDATYPVEYAYDGYGRMTEMRTYHTGTSWNGDTWPEGEVADVTRWMYQESTGLLLAKEDAAGKRTVYTYDVGGRLKTRTWARKDGETDLVTTYIYDPNTGELTGMDYSDATPDIGFAYDRLGRQVSILDAVGTRSFTYNARLQLESETIAGLYNRTITRKYESGTMDGRNRGFRLDTGYEMTYGYDTKGRFGSVGWNVSGNSGTAAYGGRIGDALNLVI